MSLLQTVFVVHSFRSTKLGVLLAGILLASMPPSKGATINAKSPARGDVASAVASASNGDTVVIPAGTASWTARLEITKGITVIGQTTISGAGTATPTVNDQTIILDDTPRVDTTTSGVFKFTLTPTQSCRLTGITIRNGSNGTNNSNGVLSFESTGNAANYSMRVDHCHFDNVHDRAMQISGWCYGVADNNVINSYGANQSFYVHHAGIGGATTSWSDAGWADYPKFGTGDFFFIETNTLTANGLFTTNGCIDSENAARWVARFNDFTNCRPGWHGTEGSRARGTRAVEIYGNTLHWTILMTASNRSGIAIYHDNTYDGAGMHSLTVHSNLIQFRELGASGVGGGNWESSDGTSPWDKNVTEANGTWVEGHSPYLFASGTDNSSVNSEGVMHDSTKNWTTDQWAGYSITNTNPAAACYLKGAYIISNTAKSITYYFYAAGDRGPDMVFNSGDSYAIHKVLTSLDQPGRGKGDRIDKDPPVNTITSGQRWPHQALEPCMSWNNLNAYEHTPLGFNSGMPTVVLNQEYYNLGTGFPAFTIPQKVRDIYVAAVNGVAYVEEFPYPHPLAGGDGDQPIPPQNLKILP